MRIPTTIWDIDEVICKSWKPEYTDQFANGNFKEFEKGIPTYEPYGWAVIIINILLKADIKIVFITARNENYRDQTEKWLMKHIGVNKSQYDLFMRPSNDDITKDHVIKKAIWDKIKNNYDVLFAIDDKKENAELWDVLGIPSLHYISGAAYKE